MIVNANLHQSSFSIPTFKKKKDFHELPFSKALSFKPRKIKIHTLYLIIHAYYKVESAYIFIMKKIYITSGACSFYFYKYF